MDAVLNIRFDEGFGYRYTSVVIDGQWVVFATGDVVSDFNDAVALLFDNGEEEFVLSPLAQRFLYATQRYRLEYDEEDGRPRLAKIAPALVLTA